MNKSFVSIVLKNVVQDYHLFHISNLKPVLTVTPTLKLMKCFFFLYYVVALIIIFQDVFVD